MRIQTQLAFVSFCRIYIPTRIIILFMIFVRDGIHSDADHNSSRVGVGVVVVVVIVVGGGVAIFTMGYLENALSYQANFLYGDLYESKL